MYVYQLQWKFLYQTRMTLTQGGTCLKWVIDSDLIFLWMNLGYILLSIHLLIILVLSLDRYDGIQLTSILHWATQFWGWRVGYFRLLQCLWWYEHDFLHGLIITWDSFFFFFFCHDHLRQILPVNSFPNFLQTNQLCFCFDTQFLIQSIVSTIYWIGQFTISFCVIQSLYFPRKSITLALKFMQQQRKGGNAVYNCDVISKELARNKNHAVQ